MNSIKKKAYQSFVWENQDVKAHLWLKKTNMPEKVAGVTAVMEQMVETRYHIAEKGTHVYSVMCRVCGQHQETVQH